MRPELKVARAHGQMGSRELDQVMNAFYDRQYDVLLSTSIVELGLDIPSANTLIVHRSDMFGLAQLYQLRGRVGRSKIRAYAYFTIPADARLTPAAEKRLKVLQSLDTLGAGFVLASHDLDIRGAGNLLGEEQSGHIREVGYELYQSMLEEAVAAIRGGEGGVIEDQWSPRINLGTSVLIPEHYVPDLQVRLGLYRRLSGVESHEAIEAFAAELIDRFGPLPQEVRHLLDVVEIKGLCRQAGIEQIDAGPKGAVIAFRNKNFANPEGLIAFIRDEGKRVKLQPDHRLIYYGNWQTPEDRLAGARELLKRLVKIAGAVKRAACRRSSIGESRHSGAEVRRNRRKSRQPTVKLDAQPCVYILASKQNGTLYTGNALFAERGARNRYKEWKRAWRAIESVNPAELAHLYDDLLNS